METRKEPKSVFDAPAGSNAVSTVNLLELFHVNAEVAEDRYRSLYHRLVRYFSWNRQQEPEDLAQESLRRALQRLRHGQKITTQNPEAYFFGVARNVLRESWHSVLPERLDAVENLQPRSSYRKLYTEETRVFFLQCIRDLSAEELEMIVAYTEGLGDAWARKAGLKPATVRSRVSRIRKRLEALRDRRTDS